MTDRPTDGAHTRIPEDDRPAVDRDALADWLRSIHFDGTGCGTNGTGGCSYCYGPSPMDAYELAEALVESSGVLRDAADVERDALAAVEAVLEATRPGPRDFDDDEAAAWSESWHFVNNKIRAVLDGDTSALDAVKAAERKKVLAELAEHIGAHRWFGVRLARGIGNESLTEDVVAVPDLEEFIEAAREGDADDPRCPHCGGEDPSCDDPRFNDPATDGALDARMETEGDR